MSSKTSAIEVELRRGKVVGLLKAIRSDFGEPKKVRLLGVYPPALNSRDDNMLVAKVRIVVGEGVEKATYGYKYGVGWKQIGRIDQNADSIA